MTENAAILETAPAVPTHGMSFPLLQIGHVRGLS
jgi:hypothetical protein